MNLAYPCLGAYLGMMKVRELQNCPPWAVDQAPEVISSVTETRLLDMQGNQTRNLV